MMVFPGSTKATTDTVPDNKWKRRTVKTKTGKGKFKRS